MLLLLNKVFVRQFYSANTGFFLFFFFVFFGAVEGNVLVSYHLSIMNSMLNSATVLLLVFACWFLYHLKCITFILRLIDQPQCSFLYNLQAASAASQWRCSAVVYMALYAPVLVYAAVVMAVGFSTGRTGSAVAVLLFQAVSLLFFTAVVQYRLTHWLQQFRVPVIRLPLKQHFILFNLSYFLHQRKSLLFVLKTFSLILLYTILVWNRGKYDNDSFLLFYLVLLAAHAVIPYLAVQFTERELFFTRNLPLSLSKRALAFLLPYGLLLIPETIYLFVQGEGLPVEHRLAYAVNLLASLLLLTAIQYSEANSRKEYVKAVFALIFFSIFILHAQAFWFWISAQMAMAAILFVSGYRKYEKLEED